MPSARGRSSSDKAPAALFVIELVAVVANLCDGADEERQRYGLRGGRVIWRMLIASTTIAAGAGLR